MGKISNSINRYLSDNRRFADLFNVICFQGATVVRAEELSESTQVYYGITGTAGKNQSVRQTGRGERYPERRNRTRDICKQLKSGGTLRILAVENQEKVDYTMPYRCMEYDVMEYGKQIDNLRNKNRQESQKNIIEKIGGIKKTDRLAPVYTICLYHGVEAWNGPRTLSDMMDFGDKDDGFRKIFKDYPMQLYCLNEAHDLHLFHTEVGILFQALQYRRDRTGLKKLMEQDGRYKSIDVDTLEIMSVMLELPSIWKNRKKYMEKDEEDKEEYDMCQAIREWAEEERSIGRAEGQQTGFMESRRIIVRNMLLRGMVDADIMAIAECDQEFIDKVRETV
ncbi:MAG: Rpn family recombination-promoting nuclease/putative transposase [Lachnospiraceae bacterium]|nr:Rpn family recombination-promoting nuclease/putative transposase [Lachnospiraceae bacterium]